MEHILALLSQIRKLLTLNENTDTFSDVLESTDLIAIANNVFSMEDNMQPDIVYHLKGESIWILNNLACVSESSLCILLNSNI
jgi:hypothetical protein